MSRPKRPETPSIGTNVRSIGIPSGCGKRADGSLLTKVAMTVAMHAVRGFYSWVFPIVK